MQPSKYALKAGVLLQAFSDASRVMTNKNITDELAEWHLKHNPGCAVYFAVLPGKADVPDEIRSRPTRIEPTIIVPPEKELPKTDPPVKIIPTADVPEKIRDHPPKGGPSIIVLPGKEIPKTAGDFVAAILDPPVKINPPVKPLKKKVVATKRKK